MYTLYGINLFRSRSTWPANIPNSSSQTVEKSFISPLSNATLSVDVDSVVCFSQTREQKTKQNLVAPGFLLCAPEKMTKSHTIYIYTFNSVKRVMAAQISRGANELLQLWRNTTNPRVAAR